MATRMVLVLLSVFLWSAAAIAAEIQKVRVFAGDEHARIIVLNSDKISGLETRSSPATSGEGTQPELRLRPCLGSCRRSGGKTRFQNESNKARFCLHSIFQIRHYQLFDGFN